MHPSERTSHKGGEGYGRVLKSHKKNKAAGVEGVGGVPS